MEAFPVKLISTSLLALLVFSATLAAQTTRPISSNVVVDRVALELRANMEFDNGRYVDALPMLRALADMLKDRPDQLGAVQEKIRLSERQIEIGNVGAKVSLSANRKPITQPKSGETLDIAIKELGNFDYDQSTGGQIPEDVKKLSGTKVRLKGYMIPMDQAAKITQFAVVPDLFSCCFGQAPQIQHMIIATAPKGSAVQYYSDQIVIEGTLTVSEKKDDGFIVSLFQVALSDIRIDAK
jgi:hypothetical protein